jgi:uncharacterized membrane protein YjjP (DUF1212 family)
MTASCSSSRKVSGITPTAVTNVLVHTFVAAIIFCFKMNFVKDCRRSSHDGTKLWQVSAASRLRQLADEHKMRIGEAAATAINNVVEVESGTAIIAW